MKKGLVIAGILVALVVAGALLLPALAWDGAVVVHVNFQVMDQGSSRPIRDARIWVLRSSGYRVLGETNIIQTWRAPATNEKGQAAVSLTCGAGGGTFMIWRTGRYVIAHQLIIDAPGYAPITIPLANVLGNDRWPLRKRQHDRKLWLRRDDHAG